MSILVHCPCGTTLRASENLAGQKGKCPSCGRGLNISAPPHAAAKAAREEDSADASADQQSTVELSAPDELAELAEMASAGKLPAARAAHGWKASPKPEANVPPRTSARSPSPPLREPLALAPWMWYTGSFAAAAFLLLMILGVYRMSQPHTGKPPSAMAPASSAPAATRAAPAPITRPAASTRAAPTRPVPREDTFTRTLGHWESDFETFLQAFQKTTAARKDPESIFTNRSVKWTVSFESWSPTTLSMRFSEAEKGQSLSPPIEVWATLDPAQQSRAAALKPGDRVTFSGTLGYVVQQRGPDGSPTLYILGPNDCVILGVAAGPASAPSSGPATRRLEPGRADKP